MPRRFLCRSTQLPLTHAAKSASLKEQLEHAAVTASFTAAMASARLDAGVDCPVPGPCVPDCGPAGAAVRAVSSASLAVCARLATVPPVEVVAVDTSAADCEPVCNHDLPEAGRARVDRTKVTDYLLSLSHPDGRSKAEFFMRFGFKSGEWQILSDALMAVGASNPVATVVNSPPFIGSMQWT